MRVKRWKIQNSVLATKTSSNGEKAEAHKEKYTTRGRSRVYVSDLCDVCLEIKYVKRHQLALRAVKNYKFMCWSCHKMTEIPFGSGIILCKETNVDYTRTHVKSL